MGFATESYSIGAIVNNLRPTIAYPVPINARVTNLAVNVTTNNLTEILTFTVEIDAVSSSLVVSVPISTTGVFSATGSVNVTANQTCSVRLLSASAGGNVIGTYTIIIT